MTENPHSVIDLLLPEFTTLSDVIHLLNGLMLTHGIRKSYLRNWATAHNIRPQRGDYGQLLPDLITDPPAPPTDFHTYNGPKGIRLPRVPKDGKFPY